MKRIHFPKASIRPETMKEFGITDVPYAVILSSGSRFTSHIFKEEYQLTSFIERQLNQEDSSSIFGVFRHGEPIVMDIKISVHYNGYDPDEMERRVQEDTANMTPWEKQKYFDSWFGGGS